MKTITLPITWLSSIDTGWGNGYVLIPEGHPLHGKDYDSIDVDVHGGLTFASLVTKDFLTRDVYIGLLDEGDIGKWMVGFDTAHYGDSKLNWPKERVVAETERLKEQIVNYKS